MLVKLRHVKRVVAKGRVYYYHAVTRERLPDDPSAPEFALRLATIEAGRAAPPAPAIGTLGGLISAYRASPDFKETLAPASRTSYQRVFDYLQPLDAMPLPKLDGPAILRMRDKAHAKSGRWLANYVVTVLSVVCRWGVPRGLLALNPAQGLPKIRRPKDARVVNRPWTADELAVVLERFPAGLGAAVALGAYVGLRESDAVRMTRAGYRDGVVCGRQAKTGEAVWVPAHPRLKEALAAAPKTATHFVTGARGRPLTVEGFKTLFFRELAELRAEGAIGDGLTFHGLRHTVATVLAEAGCSTREIMAITGHATEAMVKRYTDTADRKANAKAAILKLQRHERRKG